MIRKAILFGVGFPLICLGFLIGLLLVPLVAGYEMAYDYYEADYNE